MEWYIKALKNYAVFSGRARRKEFWMFVLFYFIFYISALILDVILISATSGDLSFFPITIIYLLAMFIPYIAVMVRRLHDVGKSGWFYFIILIPLIGPIWFFVLMCIDGTPGMNQYGPNPKGIVNQYSPNQYQQDQNPY